MSEIYEEQLDLARDLVDAADAHKFNKASRMYKTEDDEWEGFSAVRDARHALFDFHRNLRNSEPE